MRRWIPPVLFLLGVLLLAGAATLRWVIAPSLAVLPADTDTTRHYVGTAAVAVDEAALASPGSTPLVLEDVPVAITNRTRVLDTDGDNALISSGKTVDVNGARMVEVDYRYAVNRSTMVDGSGVSDVVEQDGITFGWPIRTEKRDYMGWVQDTGRPLPLIYQGTERKQGVLTYVFEATTPVAHQITDEQALAALPDSIGKLDAVKLLPTLGLDLARSAQLQPVLLGQPDPIPFVYTLFVESTYWVEPDSGVVIDALKHELRTLGVATGDQILPVIPALDMTFSATPQTLAEAADDAREAGDKVFLLFVTLLAALALAGGVLLLLGAGWWVARRRRPTDRVPAPESTYATAG